jgi:hypothetical protein
MGQNPCDEELDRELFTTLAEAKVLTEVFRDEHNTIRPHSSLGYITRLSFQPPWYRQLQHRSDYQRAWTTNQGQARSTCGCFVGLNASPAQSELATTAPPSAVAKSNLETTVQTFCMRSSTSGTLGCATHQLGGSHNR